MQKQKIEIYKNNTGGKVLFTGGVWKEDLISVLSGIVQREGYYRSDNTSHIKSI